MKIFYSPYNLKPHKNFSGIYKSTEGCLLRFVDEKSVRESYSLYHPIVALGDLTLSEFLRFDELRAPLIKRISALCLDSSENLEGVAKSYFLSSSLEDLLNNQNQIFKDEFRLVKLKAAKLKNIDFKTLEALPFDYIFDFNGQEDISEFKNLPDREKIFLEKRVKYIEDPYPQKEKLSFKLASDFIDYGLDSDFLIVKPTGFNHKLVQSSENLGSKTVATSYLDHPVGQFLSAKWAVRNSLSHLCGLWTHTQFETNKYSDLFGSDGKIDLALSTDFIELLKTEDWRLL